MKIFMEARRQQREQEIGGAAGSLMRREGTCQHGRYREEMNATCHHHTPLHHLAKTCHAMLVCV